MSSAGDQFEIIFAPKYPNRSAHYIVMQLGLAPVEDSLRPSVA